MMAFPPVFQNFEASVSLTRALDLSQSSGNNIHEVTLSLCRKKNIRAVSDPDENVNITSVHRFLSHVIVIERVEKKLLV